MWSRATWRGQPRRRPPLHNADMASSAVCAAVRPDRPVTPRRRAASEMPLVSHLPQLREVWRVHVDVVHVPLLLTQHATVDEDAGRFQVGGVAWR